MCFLLGVTLYLRTSLGEERAYLETDAIGAASDSRALTFQGKNRRHFDPKNSAQMAIVVTVHSLVAVTRVCVTANCNSRTLL